MLQGLLYLKFLASLFCFTFRPVECAVKTWRFDNDVLSEENWENGRESTGCSGLIFPESMESTFSIPSLDTSKIVLPRYGNVLIENNTVIIFESTSKCIKLKDRPVGNWFDPENWKSKSNNRATPDLFKIPCYNDDVVFPGEKSFSVQFPPVQTKVKSIEIGRKSLTQREFKEFLRADMGSQFQIQNAYGTNNQIMITGEECDDERGCLCFDETGYMDALDACPIVLKRRNDDKECFDDVPLYGHCGGFCGAVLTVKITPNTALHKIAMSVPEYDDVDTYISRIDNENIQIAFADKNRYDEDSNDRAKSVYNHLINNLRTYAIKGVTIWTAGRPYIKGNPVSTAFSIIFGTFFGACLLFAIIYYVYVGPGRNYVFIPSWNFRDNFPSMYFARFDNKDGGDIKFAEEESPTGSVMDLERSFDNPLYGAPTPMVVKRSDSIKTTATEMSIENPLYKEIEEEKLVNPDSSEE